LELGEQLLQEVVQDDDEFVAQPRELEELRVIVHVRFLALA
jgi:hypothetical protein